MKKSIIIVISFLTVFILCSLSYQPIIADTPIEEIKETKLSVSKIDRLRDFHKKLLERKAKEDCGCGDTTGWDFPIICDILFLILLFGIILVLHNIGSGIIGATAIVLGKTLNCSWAW